MKASHFILAEAFLEIQTLSMTAIQFGTRRGKRRETKTGKKDKSIAIVQASVLMSWIKMAEVVSSGEKWSGWG